MKLFSIILLACFIFNAKASVSQTINREQFKEYYLSGNYFKAIEKKLIDAKDYLDRQLNYPRANRLAIVLDVDETVLSNYRDLERLHFNHNEQALTAAHMLSGAETITPVKELYEYAIQKGVAVFFISERPNLPEMMSMTVKNLKKAGFDQWDELILKPINQFISIQTFKTNARRQIAARGFDVVINIGDQECDLKGGYAEVKVKLPNPFYTLAER